MKRFLAILILPAVVFAYSYEREVTTVTDGDTIVLDNLETVRLIGIDTPETVHPSKPVEYFGQEASEYTQSKLLGEMVRIEYDQEKVDRYGRTLAYVFFDSAWGDTLFNLLIIEDGYAFAYTEYPFEEEHMARFRDAERTARDFERGLWTDPDRIDTDLSYRPLHELVEISEKFEPPPTEDVLASLPGGYVVASNQSDKYHLPVCRYAERIHSWNLITFESVSAATRASYSPCSVCFPPVTTTTTTTYIDEDTGSCDYWLNTDSWVRHNRGCRYYKNTKYGRCCTKSEGRACGICGG